MISPRILEKIEKCLALSHSSNEHEAAAAMRQAQKLMTKYGVGADDITAASIETAEVKSVVSVSRPKAWEVALAQTVAKAFGCRVVWHKSDSYAADYWGRFVFIGLKDQLQIASYTMVVLQRRLVNARVEYTRSLPSQLARKEKTRMADGYCEGWVIAIRKTVNEFALGEEHAKAIERRYNEVASSRANVQHRTDDVARAQGHQAGSKESIYRPMTGRDSVKLTHDKD